MKRKDKCRISGIKPEPPPQGFVRSAHYEALHMIERTDRERFMRMSTHAKRGLEL